MEQIMTTNGLVEGLKEDGILKWYGIPYAKPPVGELRFRRPQPLEPWVGVKQTKQFNKQSWQMNTETEQYEPEKNSEDVLYLNIWSNGTSIKKPVYVWIFGGGFIVGKASEAMYDGTRFAKDDIVAVTISYRVGVLGFSDFSYLSDEHHTFESNCGLADMVAALAWIKENIDQFGGDPENVTIGGESAGAAAVKYLLSSKTSNQYFKKAIMESDPVCVRRSHAQAKELSENMIELLKQKGDTADVLKSIPPLELLTSIPSKFLSNNEDHTNFLPLCPIQDDLFPEFPLDAIQKGIAKNNIVMIGTNKDEGTAFSIRTKTFDTMSYLKNYPNISEDRRNQLITYYGRFHGRRRQDEYIKDTCFILNTTQFVQDQSKWNSIYTYRMDTYYGPFILKIMKLRAFHGCEIAFAFGNLNRKKKNGSPKKLPKKILALETKFHESWCNFIKDGVPCKNQIEWPSYSKNNPSIYVFDTTCHLAKAYGNDIQLLWKGIR